MPRYPFGRVGIATLSIAACLSFSDQLEPQAVAATSNCAYNQSSGTKSTFFATCETVNGNLVQFTSPAGVEDIRVGAIDEGYGICDGTNDLRYYDWAGGGDSAGKGAGFVGWDAPVKLSSSPLKISRTTADGGLTLTQTFTRNNSDYTMKINMTVVNHRAAALIRLTRLVDIDANKTFNNDFLESIDSVLGLAEGLHGLQLFLLSNPTSHSLGVIDFSGAPFVDPCVFTDRGPTPITNEDDLGWVEYQFNLGPGAAKTVAVEYRRF